MTARRCCPPAPGPLEDFAVQFDSLFHSLSQRHCFRTYLAGLLAPRDRPKTLTTLAGAEPVIQAQTAPVQQMQFFLSESNWDADQIAQRTLQMLLADPLIAPASAGVLAIDDTGDRKDGRSCSAPLITSGSLAGFQVGQHPDPRAALRFANAGWRPQSTRSLYCLDSVGEYVLLAHEWRPGLHRSYSHVRLQGILRHILVV